MTGFDVYKEYIAIKSHFSSSSYDYFKYHGKTKAKLATYEKRNDRKFFELLAKKGRKTVIQFMIAQFVHNPNEWIGDMVLNQEAIERFLEWKKRTANIYRTAENDLKKIIEFMEAESLNFKDIFKAEKNKLPIILRLVIEGYVCLETYIVLMSVLGLDNHYDKVYDGDVVYQKYKTKINAYKAFLKPDRDKAYLAMKNALGGK